jgi:hypothetical protein
VISEDDIEEERKKMEEDLKGWDVILFFIYGEVITIHADTSYPMSRKNVKRVPCLHSQSATLRSMCEDSFTKIQKLKTPLA